MYVELNSIATKNCKTYKLQDILKKDIVKNKLCQVNCQMSNL